MLLLLALDYLPQQEPAEPGRAKHLRDAVLATFAGAGVAALAWAIMSRPGVDGLAGYFLQNSVPGGGGHNVVNVILVDFRGYDTMGEITVLGIAALGILVLLSRIDLVTTQPDRAPALDRAPLLLTMITRALLPLAILFSIYLMLRGHNSPGGGFIGGLMAAVAIVIQYVASGESWTDVRLRGDFRPLIAIGLGIALLTGAGALVFGYPFLSATFTHVHAPVLGDFELATAVLFDLGVFLTVISIVIVILSQLGKLVPPRETDASDGGERSVWKP
jgi:multicomponent K+:H+ antiporter subunit A